MPLCCPALAALVQGVRLCPSRPRQRRAVPRTALANYVIGSSERIPLTWPKYIYERKTFAFPMEAIIQEKEYLEK